MRLGREKINHLSKILMKNLDSNDMVDYIHEDNDVRLQIVKIITEELKIDDEIDKEVRNIITSYSKKIHEGTDEWDVMYQKHYEELLGKKRGL